MSHSVLQLPADPASDDGEDNASETYVDLDRGIDSDIELTAVTTRANPLSSSSGAEGPADVHCSALEVPSDRRDADSSPGDHVQRVSSPESVLVSKSDVPMLDRSLSPSHTPAPCDVPECVPSEPPSGDPTPTEGSGQDLQSESERLIGHSGLPPTEISCLSGAAAAEKESSVESEICPVEKAASSEDGAIVSPGSHSVLLTDQPDPPSYCSTVTLTIENEKPPVLAQSPTTEPDIATVVEPAVSCSEEETAETIPSRRMSPPRSSDTRMSPPRSPDTRMSPPRSPDTRMSPPRSSDTRMSPPRSPDTRMSPPRSPDEIVLPPPPPPIKFTLPPPSTPPGGTGFEDNFDPEDWSYGCARRSSAPVVNGALVASTPKDHRKTPSWGLPVSSHEGPESMPLHGRHGKDSVELSAIPRSRSIDDIQEEEDALAGATLAAAESLESEVTSEEEDEVTDEATNPNQGFPNSSSNSALVRESALGSKTKRPHQRSLASSASEQKKQMKKFAIGLGEESDTMPDTPNRLWPNTKTKDERYHIDPETMEVSTVGEAYRKDAQRKWKHYASASFWSMTSALYGKILVVMGLAFPLAEVISNDVPTYFFNGFYLYLKLGSVVFLLYVYIYLISTKKLTSRGLKRAATNDSLSVATFFIRSAKSMASLHDYFRKNLGKETSNGKKSGPSRTLSKEEGSASIDLDEGMDDGLQSSSQGGGFMRTDSSSDGGPHLIPFIKEEESVHYGSFYLRLGVVAFGTGNMIYSGLEVTRFIDMEEGCSAPLTPLAAGVRCLFTFIQMYFVFLNSKMMIPKRFYLGQFGLMHMIATNLCVWLHVLVEESKHEFLTLTTEGDYISDVSHTGGEHLSNTTEEHHVLKDEGHLPKDVASDLHDKHSLHYCDRSSVMGRLVQDASPFLFPCVIEYSLICAAILYVMWKNLNPKPPDEAGKNKTKSSHSMIKITSKQSRHVYHMDCEGANRGLFVGILVMVLTAISLIVFFVLMQSDEMKDMAITEANISELCLYTLTSLAACIGMFRMRNMRYEMGKDLEIDQILLIVAQSGLFLYSIFVIIGSYFVAAWDISVIPMITGLAMLIQAILQTAFILDASRRCCTNSKQVRDKPGREFVTFLLISNLAMWAINTLETNRASAHPIHVKFYGEWAWITIIHISMPLTIFYRFHSTVCLCEIWSKSYKIRGIQV